MAKSPNPPFGPGLVGRRNWLKLIAALGAVSGAAALPAAEAQQSGVPSSTPPQRVSKEMVQAALATIGLAFTGPQIDMMLPAVNRSLAQYERLRAVDVPLDTPPAILFSPV